MTQEQTQYYADLVARGDFIAADIFMRQCLRLNATAGVAEGRHQTLSDQSPTPAPPQPQAQQADQKLLEQAGEALESCTEGGYRDIDGDWCERLHYDKSKVAASLAAIRARLGQGEKT
jgi:hypothetical protein